MTIYDISKKAGVSIATVSRVINGKKGVNEQTRKRILDVVEEIGYMPNAFARGLGLNTVKSVGIMCQDVSDIYLANAVSTLERELRLRGYDSLLCCTGTEEDARKSYLGILLSKRVDAVLLVGSQFIQGDTAYIEEAAQRVPIILVNGYLKAENVYCVLCDDFGAIRDAASFLFEKGRKRILYLYDTDTYSGTQKLLGLKQAHEQANIALDTQLVVQCKRCVEQVYTQVRSLWEKGLRFDAVLASDDELAVGAMKALTSCGQIIARDIDVIGFNNSILSRCSEPELTSIDSRVEALCMTAVSMLFGIIEGKDFPDRTLLSANLVKRRTT